MTASIDAPEGFSVVRGTSSTLVVSDRWRATALGADLDRPETWDALLRGPGGRTVGRGAVARLRTATGPGLVLKRMRRGGIAGPLWRGRFAGSRRLAENLHVPLAAAARGVPTAAPAALLVVEGPRGLYRGWLALEEIPGAADLAGRVLGGPEPKSDEIDSAARAVRTMHDAGVEHRDLNLGNLRVRSSDAAPPEAFVIDLDRARLHPGPLPFVSRRRSLLRLERSWVKLAGAIAAAAPAVDRVYAAYAGDDRDLARRLDAGRATGRFWIRVHRLGRSGPGGAGRSRRAGP